MPRITQLVALLLVALLLSSSPATAESENKEEKKAQREAEKSEANPDEPAETPSESTGDSPSGTSESDDWFLKTGGCDPVGVQQGQQDVITTKESSLPPDPLAWADPRR